MSSYLSSGDKAAIQAIFTDLHDTFSRTIYVYVKTKASASWSTNPLYGNNDPSASLSNQETLTKHSYSARVWYADKQKETIYDGGGQTNLPLSEGKLRIKVKSDAYEKIKICERIEVDSILYVLDGDAKVVGPFDAQYYLLYLKREN